MQSGRRTAEDLMARTRSIVVLLGAAMALSVQAASAQTPATAEKTEAFGAAARRGDAATVAKLLDEGVDVNAKFRYDVTALFYACDHGHLEVVKVLLARGATVNLKDTFYGATPLTWASGPAQKRKPEHAQIVGLLLKAGAQGKEGALSAAVSASDAPMVKVVLDSGGLPDTALADALETASRAKKTEIVTLLEAAGAKPHPEFKMEPAQLGKYTGTFRAPNGNEIVMVVADGRLFMDLSKLGGPPKLAMVARNEMTFVSPDAPGLRVTVKLDAGQAAALVVGPNTYTRTGGI
jgi:Ankyrin repeats (3 copies)